MRWNAGREVLEGMLLANPPRLQRVAPSREHAERLIAQARSHLASASLLASDDPEGAYALLYDAARKSLTAILENQGLRPTSAGGHVAVYDAVRAQLDPPMGSTIRPFDRMRRNRRDAEYPPSDAPSIDVDMVLEDLPKSRALVDIAVQVLDEMSPF